MVGKRSISDAAAVAATGRSTISVLVILLVTSAFLTSVAVVSGHHSWLGWVGLIPLFVSIRLLSPCGAMASGALWGVCLGVFLSALTPAAPAPTFASFLLLTSIPAAYAYGAARISRRYGFDPLVLGLGWAAVELALQPVGLRWGLLAGTQANGTLMSWLGEAMGYVLVAFLVASINATLLLALAVVRFKLGGLRFRTVPKRRGCLRALTSTYYSSFFDVCSAQPRAPPR